MEHDTFFIRQFGHKELTRSDIQRVCFGPAGLNGRIEVPQGPGHRWKAPEAPPGHFECFVDQQIRDNLALGQASPFPAV
jgi:hypothetical protein